MYCVNHITRDTDKDITSSSGYKLVCSGHYFSGSNLIMFHAEDHRALVKTSGVQISKISDLEMSRPSPFLMPLSEEINSVPP